MACISQSKNTAPGLARSLRRWDVVAVVLNAVIGAGIFGLPSKVFSLSGDYSLLAFVVCAVCAATIVLSFAEVASRYSGTGGPYLYARDTYGPLTGFTVGWLVWIARVTSFAANCSLLPEYLDFFFPGAGSGIPRAAIVTAVVGLLTAVNLRGVSLMAKASNVFAVGKLLPLAIFVIAGLFYLDRSHFTFSALPSYGSFSQSVLLLVYAFTGFEMAVIPAGEIRNPERNIPMGLLTGMAVVVTFYVMIQLVCIGTLPGPELAASHRPLADAVGRFMGNGGALMITAGIVISLAGNLNVTILAASRILFAMAEGDELPRFFGHTHARYRTPTFAILSTIGIMLALTLSGQFIYLVTLSTIARLVGYLVTCSAVPVLRRRAAAPRAAFLVPGGAIISIFGVCIAVWLLSSITGREARDALIAVALGLLLYMLNRWKVARSSSRAQLPGKVDGIGG